MTGTRPAEILRHLDPPGPDDRALVARFAAHCDQEAFAELVRRHGPLVWAACLRVAGHRQDAEDAFQAAFLVLARRAAAVGHPDLLGNWLYGVAVRVAMRARRSAARRRAREVQVPTMPDPPCADREANPDFGPVLDEELARLPGWYREAVVLCDLRGVPRAEAAKQLGIPEGTLSSRLANGRKKLAARLAKRGIALSVVAVPGVLRNAARAAVPAELAARANQVATGTAVPAAVARLVSGDFTMTTKLLIGVVGAAALAAGAVLASRPDDPPKPADPATPPVAAKADPARDQKADPDAERNESGAFTTSPRMRYRRDSSITNVTRLVWSPDGNLLAHQGTWTGGKAGGNGTNSVGVYGSFSEPEGFSTRIPLGKSQNLIGFTNDGKALILDQREYELVSGFHRIEYLSLEEGAVPGPGGFGGGGRAKKDVDLDSDTTHGYAFAADGKTFRTVAFKQESKIGEWRSLSDIAVRSVDAGTGKTINAPLKLEGEYRGYSLSADGSRLAVTNAAYVVAVFDVEKGQRRWVKKASDDGTVPRTSQLLLSPDGSRLAVLGRDVKSVFSASTGDLFPKLEESNNLSPDYYTFSQRGRLLAVSGGHHEQPFNEYLAVWDTDTGKMLRKWNRRAVVAFHPSKPILAVAEPNGDNATRLGLWDFAAEAGKK